MFIQITLFNDTASHHTT